MTSCSDKLTHLFKKHNKPIHPMTDSVPHLKIFDGYLRNEVFPVLNSTASADKSIWWKYLCTTTHLLKQQDINAATIEYYKLLLKQQILQKIFDELRIDHPKIASELITNYHNVRKWTASTAIIPLHYCRKNKLDEPTTLQQYFQQQNNNSNGGGNSVPIECTQQQEYSRHFKSWIEKILALNIHHHIKKVQAKYDEFKRIILMKYPSVNDRKNITPYRMRCLLKEYGCSKLNEVVSIIMKDVCEISIPDFSESEINHIETAFLLLATIYDHLCVSDPKVKELRKHYPYLIYKIIDMKYRVDIQKRQILTYVPLQKHQTLIKNEEVWRKIINEAKKRNIFEIGYGLMEQPIVINYYPIDPKEMTSIV